MVLCFLVPVTLFIILVAGRLFFSDLQKKNILEFFSRLKEHEDLFFFFFFFLELNARAVPGSMKFPVLQGRP